MYLDDYGTTEGMGYEGRVSYSGQPKNGDLSIILRKLTMDDNGTYECSVRLRADPPLMHAQLDLVVLGKAFCTSDQYQPCILIQ